LPQRAGGLGQPTAREHAAEAGSELRQADPLREWGLPHNNRHAHGPV